MLFAVICEDKPGALELRKANRPAHLAYLEESGVVAQAGAFLDAADLPCGSLVILEAEDLAAAKAWAAGDPFALAGVFAKVEVRPWRRVIG